MAVRFVPSEEPGLVHNRDRENLAEVIDLRSRIVLDASDIAEALPEQDIFDVARRTLSRKAMSSGELRNALKERDFSAEEVEEVIYDFEESLYLDDLGLSRIIVEKLQSSKKMSKSQIKLKLLGRKISPRIVEEAVSDIADEDDLSILQEVAFKRAKSLESLPLETAKRRLFGYLARRGWTGSDVTRIVNEALDKS